MATLTLLRIAVLREARRHRHAGRRHRVCRRAPSSLPPGARHGTPRGTGTSGGGRAALTERVSDGIVPITKKPKKTAADPAHVHPYDDLRSHGGPRSRHKRTDDVTARSMAAQRPAPPPLRCCVVGAGFAGLSAARRLLQPTADVLAALLPHTQQKERPAQRSALSATALTSKHVDEGCHRSGSK